MKWEVLLHEEFVKWLDEQKPSIRNEIIAHTKLLAEHGANLGRPSVDSLKGSSFKNMKELRIQWKGEPWRILFAFDPKRRSILLVGGSKQNDKRWYEKNIPIADKRFSQHLAEMEGQNEHKT